MLTLLITTILSLSADFTQTKQVAMMREPQVSKGVIIYRAPHYLKWQYTQPDTITWEIDGESTNVNPHIRNLLRMVMASISGENLRDNADFDVIQNGNLYTLTPLKREYKKLFKQIRLTLNPKNNVAQHVEMDETGGDTTIIDFYHIVTK